MIDNSLTHRVIGCAMEVHRHLGPGLLEKAYEEALIWEINRHRLMVSRQVPIPVQYTKHTS
jgi:GxxExxY protein